MAERSSPLLWLLLPLAVAGCAVAATDVDEALRQSGRASVAASASAGHALVASGRTTLGVSAVPFLASQGVAGVSGAASGAAARASTEAAWGRGPLPVTDETIVVLPPDQALKR